MALTVGSIMEGKITGITNFGAFVSLEGGKSAMVHISEVANTFVKEIRDFVSENDTVKVMITGISPDGKISCSIKRAQAASRSQNAESAGSNKPKSPPAEFDWGKKNEEMSFEDKLNKFKQDSDEKMHTLKKYMDAKRGGAKRSSSKY